MGLLDKASNGFVARQRSGKDPPRHDQREHAVTEQGPPERLRALITRRLRELGTPGSPMSAFAAHARAGPHPGVSYENLRLLGRGKGRGKITDRTAEGLAKVLEVSVAEVYAAAGIPTPGQRWSPPERFARLTEYQRGLVESFAAALLEAYDKGRRDLVDELRQSGDAADSGS